MAIASALSSLGFRVRRSSSPSTNVGFWRTGSPPVQVTLKLKLDLDQTQSHDYRSTNRILATPTHAIVANRSTSPRKTDDRSNFARHKQFSELSIKRFVQQYYQERPHQDANSRRSPPHVDFSNMVAHFAISKRRSRASPPHVGLSDMVASFAISKRGSRKSA